MDPQQIQAYHESIQYCTALLSKLEWEKDTIRRCFHGEPLRAYLEATELAIQRTKYLRDTLHRLQQMQP